MAFAKPNVNALSKPTHETDERDFGHSMLGPLEKLLLGYIEHNLDI